jgi:hypothetical protein
MHEFTSGYITTYEEEAKIVSQHFAFLSSFFGGRYLEASNENTLAIQKGILARLRENWTR